MVVAFNKATVTAKRASKATFLQKIQKCILGKKIPVLYDVSVVVELDEPNAVCVHDSIVFGLDTHIGYMVMEKSEGKFTATSHQLLESKPKITEKRLFIYFSSFREK